MSSFRLMFAVVTMLSVASCGGTQQGTGKMSVMITDAPGDFKAAVVTITRIDLQGSGGTTVLSNNLVTTNLLTLSNGASTLVQDAVVPAGKYTELDFVISGGYVEVVEGGLTTIYASSPTYEGLPAGAKVGGTLKMPSFAESGLKVKLPDGTVIATSDSKVLFVDFNVAQSFGHEAGNSGSWVMHPVVTATDFGLSGSLDIAVALGMGVTLPAPYTLGSFDAVLTYPDGVTTKALLLGVSGDVTYKYLVPGTYALGLALDPLVAGTVAITTAPAIPASVTIRSGAATQATLSITSAH